MEVANIKEAIKLAKEIVEDEDEPYKTEAFKIILVKLLDSEEIKAKKGIPEKIMEKIGELRNKEKIQLILYYTDKPLTKEEIKAKSLELGIDEGWWHGSNFRRDLIKRNKLVVEEKDGDVTRYKLTEVARVATKKLIEELL